MIRSTSSARSSVAPVVAEWAAAAEQLLSRLSLEAVVITLDKHGAYLATAGDWQVTAIVRRAGRPDLEAPFELTATQDGLRPSNLPASDADEALSPRALLLGSLWVAAAAGLAAGAWWSRRGRRSLSWGLLALALVSLMTGSLLIVAGSAVAGG